MFAYVLQNMKHNICVDCGVWSVDYGLVNITIT